ncbi:Protein kinase domain-containing protein [Plasmodiophora brassicae]|uniref:Protein kinase domain-containing protein n=1 Tax=Plasmodiophora brassicae TaxID=37360 RepID=A0A3P3YIM7_PLABS|nr:unnamed protein product [Plasmodiophora brassicae]
MGCVCSTPPNPNKVDMTHFTLLRTIGKGGFGTVTAVMKESEPFRGKYFAIKKLAKCQLIESSSGIKVAWRERNILQMIDSPFLPKLHWAFQDEACLYLVMDFLSGGDIGYLIKQKKRIEVDLARYYAAEIALGMQELHEKKIVYRDLKPANVLLDKRGHCHIIDFGIASILDEKNNYKACGDAGTPGYQSPEMCNGDSYQFEPDFFAYGITIYQMLAGVRPFDDNTHTLKCNCVPRSWKHVPQDAQDLITKLLDPNPAKRLCDWRAVKNHAFFRECDWAKLARCEGDGPFVPDPDIANFPIECNAEALLMPEPDKPIKDQTIFQGYTYEGHKKQALDVPAGGKAIVDHTLPNSAPPSNPGHAVASPEGSAVPADRTTAVP